MRRYDGILLDVDGTLADSNDAHAHAWVEALAEFDIEVAYSRVRQLIGMGGDRVIELVGGLARDSRDNARIGERRSEIFRERWMHHVKPLTGTREMILRLRAEQYQFVIATAARADELTPLLEIAGIADLCDRITTSSEVEASKPDPEIVEAALAKLPIQRSRAVMFGDTPYDIEACRGANVDIIAFTTGGWSHGDLAGAIAVYEGPADLLANWSASPLAAKTPSI